MLLLTNKIYI